MIRRKLSFLLAKLFIFFFKSYKNCNDILFELLVAAHVLVYGKKKTHNIKMLHTLQ